MGAFALSNSPVLSPDLLRSVASQKIELAERDTLVPQDAIGGGQVKEEVGQYDARRMLLGRQSERFIEEHWQRIALPAPELLWTYRLEIIDCRPDARLEILEACLVIADPRRILPREMPGEIDGHKTRILHLLQQVEHVGIKLLIEQRLDADARLFRMRLRLLQDARQILEPLDEQGYGEGLYGLPRHSLFHDC